MRERVQSVEELDVWRRSLDFVCCVYELTKSFPESERYGLTQQLRRAAISVPANIAEGWGRGTRAHLANFARIARGSALEARTLLLVAERLEYSVDGDRTIEVADEVVRLVTAFLNSLVPGEVREDQTFYDAVATNHSLFPSPLS